MKAEVAEAPLDFKAFAKSQLYLIILALAFATPTVLFVLGITRLLHFLSESPLHTDGAILFAVLAVFFLEVTICISMGFEIHGKRSLIVQLPSLLIIVVGSIGTGIIACRFDPSQYRTVFICGYLSLHWIGTFIWRALSYGFGVIAVEQDPKPSQPPKSSLNPANFLKKLAMHVVMTTITMCMVVIGLIGVSACVQVARIYGDNFVVSFVLFVLLSFAQYACTVLAIKINPSNKESFQKKAEEGYSSPGVAMFNVPLKLFRFMQATRAKSYIFFLLLLGSQIFDKIVTRYFAARYEVKRLSIVDQSREGGDDDHVDIVDSQSMNDLDSWKPPLNVDGGLASNDLFRKNGDVATVHTKEFLQGIESFAPQNSINASSEVKADIQQASSQTQTNLEAATSLDMLPTAIRPQLQSALLSQYSAFGNKHTMGVVFSSRAEQKLGKTLTRHFQGVEKQIRTRLPYECLRRDLCFAEYLSLFLSLGLILATPSDFLLKPASASVYFRGFYDDGSYINVTDVDVDVINSDLVLITGSKLWRTMMLVACISFLFAFFIEGSIVIWEKRVGFPLYNCVFQFRGFRVSVIINFFLLFATCWIMAGARGLFAYGPLNAGYT